MDTPTYEFHTQILRLLKGVLKAYEAWLSTRRPA